MTRTFFRFVKSEQVGGALLLACTVVSLLLANSRFGADWLTLWQMEVGGLTLQHWVNDGLMAVFFLLVGLELERELYVGELSDFRNALLPIVAAFGGVVVPAAIHFSLNAGTTSQAGAGIPMATDIAFALAAVAVLGSRVPVSLKVFITAVAVMDDLVAILVIAVAYTSKISLVHLLGASAVFAALVSMNRLRIMALTPYLVGGSLLWLLMLKSGIHATVAGVALAFAIPFSARSEDETSPSHRLEHALHGWVAFAVLPAFALANTGLVISGTMTSLADMNSLGIILGLVLGKPIGILTACVVAVGLGLRRPAGLEWGHIVGAGMLAGIGFTMSIFIATLAFPSDPALSSSSKVAIMVASASAAVLGLLWLELHDRLKKGAKPLRGEPT